MGGKTRRIGSLYSGKAVGEQLSMSPEQESDLLNKACGGDQDALQDLLFQHYDALTQHISPRIGAQYRALIGVEDILQETCVQAFRDIQKFQRRPGSSFVGWLKAIAENRLMDAIKAQQRKKRGGDYNRVEGGDAFRSSIADFIAVLEDEGETPSRMVAKDEAINAMQVAIAGLPDDQREAVNLRCLQGKSIEDTAKEMNRSASAIRSLIHRAKQALHSTMYRTSIWLTKK